MPSPVRPELSILKGVDVVEPSYCFSDIVPLELPFCETIPKSPLAESKKVIWFVPSESFSATLAKLLEAPTICKSADECIELVVPIKTRPEASILSLSAEFVKNPIAPAELSLDLRANIFGVEE